MEDTELREFDLEIVRRWEKYTEEQRRGLDELGVPYMANRNSKDDENREKIMGFVEDIISDIPPYLKVAFNSQI